MTDEYKPDDLKTYRDHLIRADQASLESYDKSLLFLSGGALALTITFMNDIVGMQNINCWEIAVFAWTAWIVSIGLTLTSFYVSHCALRMAIQQVDNNLIHKEKKAGGHWHTAVDVLNALSGFFFLVGMVFIVVFVAKNMR